MKSFTEQMSLKESILYCLAKLLISSHEYFLVIIQTDNTIVYRKHAFAIEGGLNCSLVFITFCEDGTSPELQFTFVCIWKN